jgi:cell division protein FtsB
MPPACACGGCDDLLREMSPLVKSADSAAAAPLPRRLLLGVYGARRKIATGFAGLLALTVGYHVVFGQNGLIAYRGKRHEVRSLQMQTDDLQTENGRLRSHVDRLGSDPNAIEHEARESLHYTRPGEVIYTLPGDSK